VPLTPPCSRLRRVFLLLVSVALGFFLIALLIRVGKINLHLTLLQVQNISRFAFVRLRQWLQKRPRYHLHFTPTHASWLNQQPKPFHWTKSADQILASIARFATAALAAHSHATYTRNQ
jgi:hypothetical protein